MKVFKKILKTILILLLVVILAVGGYVAYVFIAYHRLGNSEIVPEGQAPGEKAGEGPYKIVSYNIGFGAYEADYGFFMDGGTESRAWSRERLDANLKKIADLLKGEDADFLFVEEVDVGSTRSYNFDERTYLTDALPDYSRTFAQNFDSPYLFYPILKPHGIARSGLLTFSSVGISSAERVELPVETGLMKLLDLDRCYSKSRVPTADGKELVLYCFHLSAYTSDGKITNEQLLLLVADMEKEYESGNYCVAGGDFNKDILGDSSKYFGKADKEYTWAHPIPEDAFDGTHVSLVAPLDEKAPVPSCRNADGPYREGQFILTIDGFLVTDNVKAENAKVIDTGFAYSDHNPVSMEFSLVK
ncbi:MAG: endonuclease/exonuclease/phosphatase family protein [Clostridia bacterium]|nr:endonuclease/exonuclease/phosphatase family protein [Clostridia bacterium]